MLPFLCDDGWLDCIKDFLLAALTPAVEALIALIFDPILSALADAVGKVMTTIGTFWIFVDTPAVGNRDGEPASATVGWIWERTEWIAVFAAIIGMIVAGGQMAWSQRGDGMRDLLRSLITLAIASTMAVAIAQVMIEIGDQFSKCIVATALDTDATTGWTCSIAEANGQSFGDAMTVLLGLSAAAGPVGIGLMITIAIITLLASVIQVVLMVVRSAMMILLLGILPIAASATNTEMGKAWFSRVTAWFVAWWLYKPVGALIYATAIKLTGAAFEEGERNGPLAFTAQDPGTQIMNMVTGVTLLMLALFALPALMKFLVPMVAATAGSAGAGALAAKMVGADGVADKVSKSADSEGDGPSGAQNVGRPSQAPSQSPSGSQNSSPPSGSTGGASGSTGSASGSTGGASVSTAGGSGSAAGASTAGGSAAGGSAAAGGAAAGGGAAGGAAAGGAAAGAGAAAGPVGIAVVAAAIAAKKVFDTVKEGAEDLAGEIEDEGPSGSS